MEDLSYTTKSREGEFNGAIRENIQKDIKEDRKPKGNKKGHGKKSGSVRKKSSKVAAKKEEMKGLTIVRAAPSNAIDIYALLKDASEDMAFPAGGSPTDKQREHYYCSGTLFNELASPYHVWILAKRGRGFLGYVHAFAIPGRWDGKIETLAVDLTYVVKKRREMGVGRKLIEALKKEAENMGVKHIEFLADEKTKSFWSKSFGAKKLSNFMRATL